MNRQSIVASLFYVVTMLLWAFLIVCLILSGWFLVGYFLLGLSLPAMTQLEWNHQSTIHLIGWVLDLPLVASAVFLGLRFNQRWRDPRVGRSSFLFFSSVWFIFLNLPIFRSSLIHGFFWWLVSTALTWWLAQLISPVVSGSHQ